jgi:signal transduction histidine kinase/ligand-binding sensor domain-containing protein
MAFAFRAMAEAPMKPIDVGPASGTLNGLKYRYAQLGRIVGLGLGAILAAASGIASSVDEPGWLVTSWQGRDGLSNNNVEGVVQTADGHLWIALPDAVARFDGVRFERFAPEDIGIFVGHRIRTILRTHDDALWVGVDRDGLIRLKGGRSAVFAGGISGRVDMMIEDATGAVWASFTSGEIVRVQAGQVKTFTAADGVPAGSRASFGVDADGQVWCARGTQIGYFKADHFESLWRAPTSNTRIARASFGGMWVSAGFHLWRIERNGDVHDCGAMRPASAAGEITIMLEDRTGGLWIGSTTSGLARFDGVQFENVVVSDREVQALQEDREGNLWVGTAGGGLDRVREQGIALEAVPGSLSQDSIQSLCEDRSGGLWAATSNGWLAQRTNEGWKIVSAGEAAKISQAMCVASGNDGTLWIGTSNRQVLAWRDGRLTTLRAEDGVAGRTIRVLCIAHNGDVWVGEDNPNALQRIRDGKVTTFKLPPNVMHIRTMVEDAAGDLWIGSEHAGLTRAHNEEIIDESARINLATKSLRALCIDERGNLWIGLGGDGLGCLRNGKFTLFRSERGLYEENISQVVSDGRGWLWLGCDRGLFKVRVAELESVADGRSTTVQSVVYGKDQGLPPLQASYGCWPAGLRGRDGRLWIPMRSGLAAIFPARLRNDPLPIPVVLKAVSIDDTLVASYDGPAPIASRLPAGRVGLQEPPVRLQIPPGYRRLAFDFTALSMIAPDSIQFRYRIEGFDDKWGSSTTEREATYPRLDAGDYRFEVIARNADGIWNKTGPSLAFTVAPFTWQTWWFRVLAITLFTGVVAAVVRYVSFRRLQANVRALKEQAALDKERARIARDIHDDVGGRLTRIMLLTGLALRERKDPEKASARVGEIAVSARQVIKSLDETVWAINPRNDTLPDLINYVGQFAVEFMRTADLPCQVELPDHPPRRRVSAEARHNLFLAVKEALNNVVRHAGRCEVRVQIKPDPDALRIVISDNGVGFGGGEEGPGADGLRNMQQRLAELGGRCEVDSQPGAGTRITFVYFWPATGAEEFGTPNDEPAKEKNSG